MKKDKGFEINYWNLSYRRKFIRTLWTIPLIIPASTMLIWHCYHSKIVALVYFVLLSLIGIVQAVYLHKQWKKGYDENSV